LGEGKGAPKCQGKVVAAAAARFRPRSQPTATLRSGIKKEAIEGKSIKVMKNVRTFFEKVSF